MSSSEGLLGHVLTDEVEMCAQDPSSRQAVLPNRCVSIWNCTLWDLCTKSGKVQGILSMNNSSIRALDQRYLLERNSWVLVRENLAKSVWVDGRLDISSCIFLLFTLPAWRIATRVAQGLLSWVLCQPVCKPLSPWSGTAGGQPGRSHA